MEEVLSWPHLGTAVGLSAAVMVLTQILKHYIPKASPKWIALALALVITVTDQLVLGDHRPETFILSVLNAIISAGTAIGAYEAFVDPLTGKGEGGGEGGGGDG